MAYLVGRKEFYSLAFEVSPAVLIPRPESEFVVVEFLALTKNLESPRAVDVGTGSGCLAVASAFRHPGAQFMAIDISEAALAVARKNAAQHGVADRIDFRLGDRLGPVADEGPVRRDHLEPAIHPHEPDRSARSRGPRLRAPDRPWTAAPSGLDMVARLIEESVPLLKPGGHLILEIGTDQEKPVRALIEAQPVLRLAPTIHDHAQHPRVIRATSRRSGR